MQSIVQLTLRARHRHWNIRGEGQVVDIDWTRRMMLPARPSSNSVSSDVVLERLWEPESYWHAEDAVFDSANMIMVRKLSDTGCCPSLHVLVSVLENPFASRLQRLTFLKYSCCQCTWGDSVQWCPLLGMLVRLLVNWTCSIRNRQRMFSSTQYM